MTARPYPTKNPFPHQGVSSIEGATLATRSHVADILSRTLLLDAVDRTYRSLQGYVASYSPKADAEGRTIFLRGDHGSGKTHTIRYVTSRVQAESEDGRLSPTQFYGKADSTQFILVYRELMGYFDIRQFMKLNAEFVRSVVSVELNAPDEDPESLLMRLQEDETLLNRLFDAGVVEEGAVQSERARAMGQFPRRLEFQNALYYGTTVPELRKAAFDWFCGKSIDEVLERRLGVHGPLESSDDAKSALWLLARLYNRAGQPLVIYIDQVEKLAFDPDGSKHESNIRILRSLFELIAREQGALVLAGTPEAWFALTPDMHQRVGNHAHELATLKLEDAYNVVGLYLTPPEEEFPDDSADLVLFPFQHDSIREMLRFGGGNLRRLLQLCSAVFEIAHPSRNEITKETVETTVRDHDLRYFDKSNAIEDIRRILTRRSLRFQQEKHVGQAKVDFEVTSRGGKRKLLIEVRHALFHDDEALHAVESLNLIEIAQRLPEPTMVALVAVGYASPEVQERVRQVADELIVYDPESFPSRLGAVLDSLEPATEGARAEGKDLTGEFAQIRREIELLSAARTAEAKTTEERFQRLLEEQAASREADRLGEVWRQWATERGRIAQQIQTVRAERETRDLDELESLRKVATSSMYRKRILFWVAAVGLALTVGAWTFYSVKGFFSPGALLEILLGFFVPIATIAAIPIFLAWIGLQRYASSARGFQTLDGLRRAGRGLSILEATIRSIVPQARYAAVVLRCSDHDVETLLRSLVREPAALVRGEMARCVGRRTDEQHRHQVLEALEPGTPEVAYFLEAAAGGNLLGLLDGLARHGQGRRSYELALDLTQEIQSGEGALATAFNQGLSPELLPDLSHLPQAVVREVVDFLSPFERGGLGTLDYLTSIREIDRYYLFFQHLLYAMERGALPEGQSTSAPASP